MLIFTKRKTCFLFLWFFTIPIFAQLSEGDLSKPDSLLGVAYNYVESGNYDTCRVICYSVLGNYPHYNDFRILAGRTLAWENMSDSAKSVVEPIIAQSPYDKQALLLLADIEMWQEMYEKALAHVDTGLTSLPTDSELLEKRSEILKKMASKAPKTLVSYGTLFPDSNAIGATYYFEFFNKPYFARRHMFSLEYTKITNFAPLSSRVNIGDNVLNSEHLFQDPSYQFEIDAYPKIGSKSYLYLNYGIANGTFFPSHRAGFEYFQGLKKGFEVSAGMRYMYWDESITFLTGSLSKYLGAYWISFRPFISVANENNSEAYIIEGRRYFGIHNGYMFGQVIFGDSPDQPLWLAERYGNFKSSKYIIGLLHRIAQWQFSVSFGFQYEEYLSNKYRNKPDFRVGGSYVF